VTGQIGTLDATLLLLEFHGHGHSRSGRVQPI
jgi:hypothetical protein